MSFINEIHLSSAGGLVIFPIRGRCNPNLSHQYYLLPLPKGISLPFKVTDKFSEDSHLQFISLVPYTVYRLHCLKKKLMKNLTKKLQHLTKQGENKKNSWWKRIRSEMNLNGFYGGKQDSPSRLFLNNSRYLFYLPNDSSRKTISFFTNKETRCSHHLESSEARLPI